MPASRGPAPADGSDPRPQDPPLRRPRGGGGLPLRPGVARLITEARAAGLKLAVASTTSRPNVDTLVRVNFPQGDTPFDVIACGDDAARKKPAPDVFDLALQRLGVAPPRPWPSRIPPPASALPSTRPAGAGHPQPLHREPPPRRRLLGRLRPRRARRAAPAPRRPCLARGTRHPGRLAGLARAGSRLTGRAAPSAGVANSIAPATKPSAPTSPSLSHRKGTGASRRSRAARRFCGSGRSQDAALFIGPRIPVFARNDHLLGIRMQAPQAISVT